DAAGFTAGQPGAVGHAADLGVAFTGHIGDHVYGGHGRVGGEVQVGAIIGLFDDALALGVHVAARPLEAGVYVGPGGTRRHQLLGGLPTSRPVGVVVALGDQ